MLWEMILSQILVADQSLGQKYSQDVPFLMYHLQCLTLGSPLKGQTEEKRKRSCPALRRKPKARYCLWNIFLPFWGNISQPNAFHFFNTIKGKGRGRLGLIKIGSRCWRRRMGKVVIWSKGERRACGASAQLERTMGAQPGPTSAFHVERDRLQVTPTGREKSFLSTRDERKQHWSEYSYSL